MDHRLVISILAGLVSLATGVLGAILGAPSLAVVAGCAGLIAAVAGAAIAAGARGAKEQLHEVTVDRARLRRELDALAAIFAEEATRQHAGAVTTADEPGESEGVVDPVSGLLDQQFFKVIVQQRVSAARRQLQPVSVMLIELDGVGTAEPDTKEQAIGVLGEVIRRTLRECDAACRIGDSMAAAVLEDTAEAGAVWAAERVRGTLHGSPVGDSLTISAGIACYPSHALNAPELLEQAGRALGSARARGRDHVEVAQAES